jgi:hypothetical protein
MLKDTSKYIDYLNSNGLIDGNIPKGKPCPWLSQCELRDSNCPTGTNKNNDFSCGCARAFSLTTK